MLAFLILKYSIFVQVFLNDVSVLRVCTLIFLISRQYVTRNEKLSLILGPF